MSTDKHALGPQQEEVMTLILNEPIVPLKGFKRECIIIPNLHMFGVERGDQILAFRRITAQQMVTRLIEEIPHEMHVLQ